MNKLALRLEQLVVRLREEADVLEGLAEELRELGEREATFGEQLASRLKAEGEDEEESGFSEGE